MEKDAKIIIIQIMRSQKDFEDVLGKPVYNKKDAKCSDVAG